MRVQEQKYMKGGRTKCEEAPPVDIIQETRKLVKGKDQIQRFKIAKQHLENALAYKAPRLDIFSESATVGLRVCYNIQTSSEWRTFLLILSYILMYLVVLEDHSVSIGLVVLQSVILLVFWADVFMEIYHKNHEKFQLASKFELRFYVRIIVLLILLVDLALILAQPNLSIRPSSLFRCFLPLFYDANVRKAFEALLLAYKDIFVLLFFYTSVFVGFAIIANQIIQVPESVEVDPFSDNYRQLDKTIFIIYILSTYDAYPDNQLVAIRNSKWICVFFIGFIILNIFFFATIPPILVFNSFRQTRSKIVLIDEIKQQHSLIMSFVSLGEENLNISQEKIIRFLLYVYKNKVRYVDHITQICRRLDQNNNKTIHIKQYMHLCQIMQAKTSMLPPKFNDWDKWIRFRKTVNETMKLKQVVSSKAFKVGNSFLILFTFVVGLLSLYTNLRVFDIIDDILIIVFVLEIAIKVIGIGVLNFFIDPWNKLDFILVSIALTLELLPQHIIPNNSDVLSKMSRVFRVTTLIKNVSMHGQLGNAIYIKATRLISQIAIIAPIALRFLPLYVVTFYLLGMSGTQIFKEKGILNTGDSPYSQYEQFSNFLTFMSSQFLFVQVLVEAQWSTIAYDYAFKYNNFGWVMLFFVLSHTLLVTVLTSLIKGVTWEVYNTVHEEFNERLDKIIKNRIKQENLQKVKEAVKQIKANVDQRQFLMPNNLVAKKIYENKIDEQIMRKLEGHEKNVKPTRKRKRSDVIKYIMKTYNIVSGDVDEIEGKTSRSELVLNKESQFVELDDIDGEDHLEEEDIEEEMQKILQRITLNNAIQYSEVIIYPKTLVEFLEWKIKPLKTNFMDEFDVGEEESESDETKDVFVTGLNNLLGIEISERQQKSHILKDMVSQGIISEDQAQIALTKKRYEYDSSIDANWVMRKAFLSGTNEKLIKKFQIEYFSNLYGKSFKEINKVTMEPLLRLQSKLTYSLRNALRYRKTSEDKFFSILCTIEDMISNQLLKKGSLFKFVYQINQISDLWFSVQLLESNQLKIHFIKNGVWIYHKSMKPDQIMVGEDVFNCESTPNCRNESTCQKYVKMLFESFQTLAFCLSNQKNFFKFDPCQQVYNLFTLFKDVKDVGRLRQSQLAVSKIMLVVLSKEEERQRPLPYQLSQVQLDLTQKIQKSMPFRRGESENETFAKLKQMELMDHERIIESQGIPFNYIANLMLEIKSILMQNQGNFVFQLQKFLSRKLRQLQPHF